MTEVFQTVEDLAHDMESLGDLHALCRMLQKILQLNDNSIFDLFVQDEVFIGLCGILECGWRKSRIERIVADIF